MLFQNKRINVTRWLNRHEGSGWEYDRKTGQWRDGCGRWVCKVHTGGYDENGEAMPGFGYVLYGPDRHGEQIFPECVRDVVAE